MIHILAWAIIVLATALVLLSIRCWRLESRIRAHDALIARLHEMAGQRSRRLDDIRDELETLTGRALQPPDRRRSRQPRQREERNGQHRHLRSLSVVPIAGAAAWVADKADKRPVAVLLAIAGISAAILGLSSLGGNGNGTVAPKRRDEFTAAPTTTLQAETSTTTTQPAATSPRSAEVVAFPPTATTRAGPAGVTDADGPPTSSATGRAAPVSVTPAFPIDPSEGQGPEAPGGNGGGTSTSPPTGPPATAPPPTTQPLPPTTPPSPSGGELERCLLALDLWPLAEVELLCGRAG